MKWFPGILILFFLIDVPAVNAQEKPDSVSKKEIKDDARLIAADAKKAFQDIKVASKGFGKKSLEVAKIAMEETKKVVMDVKKELKK